MAPDETRAADTGGFDGVAAADMAALARDLMTASVIQYRDLKRVVASYPWAESLLPSAFDELLSPLSASPGSSGFQTPRMLDRSSVSSLGRELKRRAQSQVSNSHMSDGSVETPCAVFEPLPPEEEHKVVAVLHVVEADGIDEHQSDYDLEQSPKRRKSFTGKSWSQKVRQTSEVDSPQEETTLLDAFVGVGVILNALLVAFELECDGSANSVFVGLHDAMKCQDARPLFLVTEHLFTAAFVVELCFRICRSKPRSAYFWDWFNAFDTCLVIAGCVDLYVLQAFMGQHSYVRMLRLFKLARVVRLVRVTQMFRGLRLLVSACTSFLPALGWAMALLSLCMMMGGVTIGFLLQDYIVDENQPLEDRKWAWVHYGTAYRATYTMYEITMAGSWPARVRPVLENVSHAYVVFFVFYITVVVFAIIRVITAIFLSQTLEAANNDVEVMIQERMRKKSIFVEQLEGIFEAMDESGDGLLSEDEMKELLADPKVQAYLESLEVALPESQALFLLLQNSDGQITYEDFIEGILRCKGPARAVDQIVMQSEVKSLNNSIQKLQDKMEEAKLIHGGRKRKNKRQHTALASHLTLLSQSNPSRSRM